MEDKNKPIDNSCSSRKINRILAVVLQSQDEKNATKAIQELGLKPVMLATIGGFLGVQNITLIIPFHDELENAIIKTLKQKCRQRIEYVSTPLEGTPLPIPLSTPITVGGAIIFSFEVEYFEEY